MRLEGDMNGERVRIWEKAEVGYL